MALWLSGTLGKAPEGVFTLRRIVARQQLGEAVLWVAAKWGSGLAGQWDGARRGRPPPASLPALSSSSLASEVLSPLLSVGRGTPAAVWGAAELGSRAGLCRQIAALPPAGQVTWGEALSHSGPLFPHI